MTGPTFAASPEDLIGLWKLVSWQVIDNQSPQDVFGLHPKGYLVLTPERRAIVVTTAEHRKPGTSVAERAELERSMLDTAVDIESKAMTSSRSSACRGMRNGTGPSSGANLRRA